MKGFASTQGPNYSFPIQEDFQSMTYGFKMANSVTDLRVTGKTFTRWYTSFVFVFVSCLNSLSLFLGMLKDVEDDMQRRVKVDFFSLFFGIGFSHSSKCH